MKQKNYQLPYRVGRKQNKVVLDANGLEVCNFPTPELAQEYCNEMNKPYRVKLFNHTISLIGAPFLVIFGIIAILYLAYHIIFTPCNC